MMRKYPVRFGGGRTEKGAAGCPSLPLHYGPVNELRHKTYLAGRLPYLKPVALGAVALGAAALLGRLGQSRRGPLHRAVDAIEGPGNGR